MNSRNFALLAAFCTALIYGASYTIAKDLMPNYVQPFALIFFRVFGTCVLFWISSLFLKKEKIDREDYPRIVLGAIFGTSLNMLCFYKGLNYTTPITASAIGVMTPIMVLIFSAWLLKEKLFKKKIIGIVIGFIGALLLITYGNHLEQAEHAILGNLLVYLNAAFYGLYLVITKKLLKKYHPVHVVKWMYLIGVFIVLPFSFTEIQEVNWAVFPDDMYLRLLFVVVFSTFVNYLFNLFALSKLKPTTVGVFVYLHPVFASMYALYVGSDTLSLVKVASTLLIFAGVYLVTKPVVED
ncbi:DMT family transporter [Flavicella sediminum]|uniref:DMT family transporter n=1 Tax=Flavicella sediminum TaxID=2585141 RepID=UPI00111D9944|nr:DMT family transporter [Flavicella sediminum]